MLTANYFKGIAVLTTGRYSPYKFVNYAGQTKQASMRTYMADGMINIDSGTSTYCITMKKLGSTTGQRGIIFGTGDAEPAFHDYKLSGNIISGLTGSISTTYADNSDGATITAKCLLTNTKSNEVTIKEVGLIGSYYSGTGAEYCVLVDRAVLEEPVTIPAGGVGEVTYSITIKAPTI